MKIKHLLVLIVVGLTACKTAVTNEGISDHLLMATLWYQSSDEMKVLYLQNYDRAEKLLRENLGTTKNTEKTPAVILDIDETVLDNSPYEARLIRNNEAYQDQSWVEWVNEAVAEPLPGATNFTHTAKQLGVEVFYISNRDQESLKPTMRNLQMAGFPNADEEHILLKSSDSDKTKRREIVKKDHQVILLIGDQLSDFSEQYVMGTDTLLQHFIMMPNPMYGTFDTRVLEGKTDIPEAKKNKRRKEALKTLP